MSASATFLVRAVYIAGRWHLTVPSVLVVGLLRSVEATRPIVRVGSAVAPDALRRTGEQQIHATTDHSTMKGREPMPEALLLIRGDRHGDRWHHCGATGQCVAHELTGQAWPPNGGFPVV